MCAMRGTNKMIIIFEQIKLHCMSTKQVSNCSIKTHGSVLCGPRNPGRATDKCVF